jgi:hypothetical protein
MGSSLSKSSSSELGAAGAMSWSTGLIAKVGVGIYAPFGDWPPWKALFPVARVPPMSSPMSSNSGNGLFLKRPAPGWLYGSQ